MRPDQASRIVSESKRIDILVGGGGGGARGDDVSDGSRVSRLVVIS